MKGMMRRMTRETTAAPSAGATGTACCTACMVGYPSTFGRGADVTGDRVSEKRLEYGASRAAAQKANTESMRIAQMRIHSIAIGDPPLRSSYGLHAPYALRTILELESEDGVVGLAEAHGGDANARRFEALRPRIIGADPWRLCGALLDLI